MTEHDHEDRVFALLSAVNVAASTVRLAQRQADNAPMHATPAEGLRVTRAFGAIVDPAMRDLLLDVIEAVAAGQGQPPD